MTMATEYRSDSRGTKTLRKQPEIEEADEEENSPGSDQSDATIVAEKVDVCQSQSYGGGSPVSDSTTKPEVLCDETNNHTTQVHPKIKQLTRSQAFEDHSPPPEQQCSHSSPDLTPTNGVYLKTQTSKGTLEKTGSQSSEAGTSSSWSRDSSLDKGTYKDSTGINLEDFIRKTMNKTPKDRNMLLKLETDLTNFINEPKHHYLKFPQMSSYDRMLVHRIAAFFGLDHNVDQTGKCVIVNKTSNTRVPEFNFKEHVDARDSQKKITGIMRRMGVGSLDDKESYCRSLDKPMLGSKKAQSFEERQQQYEKVRQKIFSSCDEPIHYTEEEAPRIIKKPNRPSSLSKSNHEGQPWSSTDSSGYGTDSSVSRARGIPKANSFGGMGSVSYNNQALKFPHKSLSLSVEPSRSPIHSGMSSPMGQRILPTAPTPPGSHSDSSPLSRCSSSGPVQSPLSAGYTPGPGQVYWVASDIRNIPPGSVVINPQTGQPISNADGSLYHHMPGQGPTPTGQTVYTSPQYSSDVWTPSSETPAAELCRHLSMVSINQPSLENVEEPPGQTTGPGMQTTQYVLGAQPQGQVQQQSAQVVQTQYFPGGQQNMAGAVRYMYPVNYQVQGQTQQGQAHQTVVGMDNQSFPQTGNQFPPQVAGTYQGYPANGAPGAAPNVEQFSSNIAQNTYPVIQQGEGGVQTFSSYPSQYSQNNFGQQPQGTMFYSNTTNPQMGTTTGFQYQQQGPYPGQGNTAVTMSNQSVALQNVAQPIGPGVPSPGQASAATPSTPQYLYSTVPQYQGSTRPANPQLLHFHNVPAAGQSSQSMPMLRNMQLNMQFPVQVTALQQQQQQQQQHQQQHQGGMPGQMTVSAKGYPVDSSLPKVEGIDNKDYIMSGLSNIGSGLLAGPPRPAAPIIRPTTDVRFLGQAGFHPQIQVPFPSQPLSHQPQKIRASTGQSGSKQQRLKKSKSKEGQDGSLHSQDSTELQQSNVVEVYDLPGGLKRSEAEIYLKDLVTCGAQVQFINMDGSHGDHPNLTISNCKKVLAIFPNSSVAMSALQNHGSGSNSSRFKLQHISATTISSTGADHSNIGVKS
ncbi:cAMP-regulated phosphoprotein 21-like [Mizuhopecten yessoensis]|uniref:R3H domain-containing protein 2 n=1 Tax=Mizuhopecten yessoensis TaxID=6573 RepID=A0A210Q2R9_MIZYE|nr:cAMP-regulated phosphoprotein 21-like [Mizuhopecten yessoensis]XP_021368845.1 cAMP-regulated phosphoprotein 21-like [Mizuhopecten yessoensis]XP_021368846.1 cAMP-regulated phosphoprotein 21-like [Mizuhopecten yessoensis]OWF43005.1 R3H domain-containing protein 2 [Mizuhopecten yessoensis]